MRKRSIKNTRVNSEVQREISLIIQELKDPRIDIMTSVTEVEVTPDLKYAKVFISALEDNEKDSKVLKGLEAANGFIRRELAKRLNLRNTPELRFILDDSLAYGMKIDKMLHELLDNNNSKDGQE